MDIQELSYQLLPKLYPNILRAEGPVTSIQHFNFENEEDQAFIAIATKGKPNICSFSAKQKFDYRFQKMKIKINENEIISSIECIQQVEQQKQFICSHNDGSVILYEDIGTREWQKKSELRPKSSVTNNTIVQIGIIERRRDQVFLYLKSKSDWLIGILRNNKIQFRPLDLKFKFCEVLQKVKKLIGLTEDGDFGILYASQQIELDLSEVQLISQKLKVKEGDLMIKSKLGNICQFDALDLEQNKSKVYCLYFNDQTRIYSLVTFEVNLQSLEMSLETVIEFNKQDREVKQIFVYKYDIGLNGYDVAVVFSQKIIQISTKQFEQKELNFIDREGQVSNNSQFFNYENYYSIKFQDKNYHVVAFKNDKCKDNDNIYIDLYEFV